MSDGSAIIEKQFALAKKVIDGRTHLDFAENHACLTGLFDSFREFKDQELVIYEHDRLTYGEVAAQAAHFARILTNEHSIIAGDRIGIVLPNKPEWIISFVAVAALGAVPVLINARAAEDELDYCLSSVNCRACITERATGLDIRKIHPGECRSNAAGDTALELVERDPSDEAILMFTSGTTGKPKAAVLSHQGLMSAMKTIHYSSALIAIQMAEKYGVDYETLVQMRPPPVTLLVFPLFHVSGCHAVFLSNLMQGGKIVLMSRWQPEQALELIAAEKVTGLPGVPTMHWDMLRLDNLTEYDLSSLATLSIGGQATSPALLEAMHQAFPNAILGTGYGMTECNGAVTITVGDAYVANPKSAGRLVATVKGEIRDESGQPLPKMSVGEIHVRGPSLMSGYANDNDDGVFDEDGWFATGDIGYFDEDDFLYIVDRRKDMVISGGENIYCAEVEQAIERHPAVVECAAIGQPDDRLGERLIAIVTLLPGTDTSEADILTSCSAHLTKNKVPKSIVIGSEAMPRNATGKLIKPQIRKQYEQS